MQVAPCPQPGVRMQREQWHTESDHHGYIDHYGNRCERFEIDAGSSRDRLRGRAAAHRPGRPDRARRGGDAGRRAARRTSQLHHAEPVLPARRARQRRLAAVRGLAPGWTRVQAIVDFVHGHLEWVPGASNPWTTAADAYRAGQGVCRDFAHLAITFCRALEHPRPLRVRLHPGHRRPAGRRADGLRRLVRGLPRRPLVHVRRSQQHAPAPGASSSAVAATRSTSR